MDNSPKGREIEKLDGDAEPIINRGNEITKLGRSMQASADVLEDIKNGATGEKGLAIEKLRDKVGDVYKDLRLAGERYEPTGPVLVTYGNALHTLKPKISTAVSNCESEWQTYLNKSGAIDSARPPIRLPFPEPTPEEKTKHDAEDEAFEDAQNAAQQAREAWEHEAKIFDQHYDTWEDAFDKAASDIGKATHGNISDSRWDDLDGFVAGALKVLQYVGLAIAVLGIIVGGPFIAALAAIVAIATLVLTIYSFARGNSSWLDLGLAVVGVIPFGSLGKLFNGGKMEFLGDMLGGMNSQAGWGKIFGQVTDFKGAFLTGFTRGGGGLSGLLRGLRGGGLSWMGPQGMGAGNIISRLFTGQRMSFFSGNGPGALSTLGAVMIDGNLKGVLLNMEGIGSMFTGETPHNNIPVLGGNINPLFGTPHRGNG